jgi:hypothetical protein
MMILNEKVKVPPNNSILYYFPVEVSTSTNNKGFGCGVLCTSKSNGATDFDLSLNE